MISEPFSCIVKTPLYHLIFYRIRKTVHGGIFAAGQSKPVQATKKPSSPVISDQRRRLQIQFLRGTTLFAAYTAPYRHPSMPAPITAGQPGQLTAFSRLLRGDFLPVPYRLAPSDGSLKRGSCIPSPSTHFQVMCIIIRFPVGFVKKKFTFFPAMLSKAPV